jgi:hypothetical protein
MYVMEITMKLDDKANSFLNSETDEIGVYTQQSRILLRGNQRKREGAARISDYRLASESCAASNCFWV